MHNFVDTRRGCAASLSEYTHKERKANEAASSIAFLCSSDRCRRDPHLGIARGSIYICRKIDGEESERTVQRLFFSSLLRTTPEGRKTFFNIIMCFEQIRRHFRLVINKKSDPLISRILFIFFFFPFNYYYCYFSFFFFFLFVFVLFFVSDHNKQCDDAVIFVVSGRRRNT